MSITCVTVGNTWGIVALDISVVSIVQAVGSSHCIIEIMAAASTPAETEYGVRLASMDTFMSSLVADVGTAGALYARRISGHRARLIICEPVAPDPEAPLGVIVQPEVLGDGLAEFLVLMDDESGYESFQVAPE